MRTVDRLPTIGIDVGASKIMAGVVDEQGTVLHRYERRVTPSSHAAGLVGLLTDVVRTLSAEAQVCAVGVGTAGLVVWPEGEIDYAANHDHRKVKLRRNLAAALGSDAVVVENDANAAAWAEHRVGYGADGGGLLFLAIGTGLGSGFVANNALIRGERGCGAEIGHVVVERESKVQCQCGNFGCLEALASGIALAREGRRQVAESPTGSLGRRFDRRPQQADTPAMIRAARDGDPEAIEIVQRMGELLGRTIGESVMSLFPARHVVVGGGLARLDRLLLDSMRQSCEKALVRTRCFHAPRFGISELGQDAILVGAALRAGEEATATDAVGRAIQLVRAAPTPRPTNLAVAGSR